MPPVGSVFIITVSALPVPGKLPCSGSEPFNAGTVTAPPGSTWLGGVTALAVGNCSIPKFTLDTLVVTVFKDMDPLTNPSLPAPAPTFSPVFTQLAGNKAEGADAPTVALLVVILTA